MTRRKEKIIEYMRGKICEHYREQQKIQKQNYL